MGDKTPRQCFLEFGNLCLGEVGIVLKEDNLQFLKVFKRVQVSDLIAIDEQPL